MILLDTHVLSALMQRQPDPAVMAWLNAQPAERKARGDPAPQAHKDMDCHVGYASSQ